MIDHVFKLMEQLPAVVKWWRGPLQAEVLHFQFEEIRNEPSDALWIIRSYSRSYSVTLLLTNRTDKAVYIKTILLRIAGETALRQPDPAQPIRVEAGERKEHLAVFPIKSGEPPAEQGEFKIEIHPAVGRKAKVSGRFPV